MTKNDTPQFDPRFNAAFQRGYGLDVPVREGDETAPRGPARSPVAPQRAASDAAVVDDVTVATEETDAEPAPRGVNGYLVALVVIAAGLVTAGALLFAIIRTSFDDPAAFRAESDYFLLQAIIILAPLSVMLGLATGIGVLFVHAVRRSRS